VPARRSEGAAEGTSSRCFLSSSERATTREPVSCRQEMRYWNDGWQTGVIGMTVGRQAVDAQRYWKKSFDMQTQHGDFVWQ
jgi:hypothetical protein